MKIQIHNDGKQNDVAFTAYVYLPDIQTYGPCESSVVSDLKFSIGVLIEELKNIDYKNIEYVDCRGNPIVRKA